MAMDIATMGMTATSTDGMTTAATVDGNINIMATMTDSSKRAVVRV
jgi:hypothetical protein